VSRVRTELNEVELPTLRPLLQQIADEEESARRPPLILLVQDRPAPAELAERLDEVYEYWQPLPGAAAALGA
jgi:hypothetical protein